MYVMTDTAPSVAVRGLRAGLLYFGMGWAGCGRMVIDGEEEGGG